MHRCIIATIMDENDYCHNEFTNRFLSISVNGANVLADTICVFWVDDSVLDGRVPTACD